MVMTMNNDADNKKVGEEEGYDSSVNSCKDLSLHVQILDSRVVVDRK